MKLASLILTLLLAPSVAFADNHSPLSVGMLRGNRIVLNSEVCPEGYVCIDGNDPSSMDPIDLSESGTVLMIPKWGLGTSMAHADSSGLSPDGIGPYLKGVSDKGILDVCAYCFCCEIENTDGERSPYSPDLLEHLN